MTSATHAVAFLALFYFATGHSLLGFPKPISPKECRLGGEPTGPIGTCPGPCDLRAFNSNPRINGPNRPSAIWRRGQTVTIRYQRNNHGPGGFVRLSIVPIQDMMKKNIHRRNAFHYSCWGGGVVLAGPSDRVRDRTGFSMTGSDGQFHNGPIAYYTVTATIPAVIPDGRYALGWAWYGGIGGTLAKNTPSSPFSNGFFADYWSCAFVQIRGGVALQRSFRPVFQSNMRRFWGNTCWSANNRPGVCSVEPCRRPRGFFQKPAPFTNGRQPDVLRPWMFRSRSSCSEFGRNPSSPCRPGPVPGGRRAV